MVVTKKRRCSRSTLFSNDLPAKQSDSDSRTESDNSKRSTSWNLFFAVQLDCFIQAVGLTPDGKNLAVGCVDNAVYLYSVNTKLLLHAFAHGGAVHSMAFSPDAKYLAVGGEHKTVHIWRTSEHSPPEHALALPRQGETTSVAFSRGSIGIVSSSRATIYGSGNNDYEVRARVLGPIVLPPTTHISFVFHSATLVLILFCTVDSPARICCYR